MRTLFFCLFSLFGRYAFGQLETIYLKPAVISVSQGNRINEVKIDSFIKNTAKGASVSELLSSQNVLYQRLAAVNGPQTPGLRGLSSAQTAVLWNGIPVRNNMLGLTDLSLWSGFMIDDVLVEAGSSSALNGNAAMGGTIHLQNDPENAPSFQSMAMLSSVKNLHMGIHKKFQLGKTLISVAGITALEQNQFSYNNPYEQNRSIWLTHAQSQIHQTLIQIKHPAGKIGQLTWRAMGTYADRQIPGNFVQPISEAQLFDRQMRLNMEYKVAKNQRLSQVRLAFLPEWNIYKDPKNQIHTTNRMVTYYANADHWVYRKNNTLFFKLLLNHSMGLTDSFSEAKQLFFSSLATGNIWAKKRFQTRNTVQITYAEKYLPFTFQSFNIWKLKKTEWMLQLSNGFRMPTLNEQFWVPGGNPDILPERSWHAEMGLRTMTSSFEFGTKIYFTPTVNYITWVPNGPSVVSPINAEKMIYAQGFESNLKWLRKWKTLAIVFNASIHMNSVSEHLRINPLHQLDYVPLCRILNEGRLLHKNWQYSISYQFIDKRKYQNQWLSSVHLMNTTCVFVRNRWQYVCAIQNILNVQYQWIALQPMPGINLKLQISYKL